MLSPYVPGDVDTRQLPRILCLHGGGTNAKIFQTQCRVISRRLATEFRLCFAEAPFESLPGPDVLSVYRDCGPFKAWIRPPMSVQESDSEAVMATIIRTVEGDDAEGGCGSWVGVLGFSQGAKVAASLLFHQQQNLGFGEMVFGRDLNFGLLHAGRGPFLSFASSRYGHNVELSDLLSIPTIHVHGLQDPGLDLHRNLLEQFCDRSMSQLVEWAGPHRLPIKTADVEAVVQEIFALRSTWEKIIRPSVRETRVDSAMDISFVKG
ncbi:hypothetical protein D6D28_05290 [Aureobasidium pullulans]|uniref:Serine hydrolase domain-containing protein n=1 Tax=Aureobasidium pullulans TaxID=5580 RepID=A0A4S8SHU8_AURPU|nr:hypothetical protein D6D28_05290 [Aureobasidium pullulans]